MSFLLGLTYPIRGLATIAHSPRLWPFVVWPILVNLVVGAALTVVLLAAGFHAIDVLLAQLPEWLAPIAWLPRVGFVISLLIVTGYVIVRFGVILGSPWYSRLAERLEEERIGRDRPDPPGGLRGALAEVRRTIGLELKKLVLVLAVGGGFLLVELIPGAGTMIGTAGGIALGATVACLDVIGPVLDRRRLGFRQRLALIGQGLPGTAGLGLACLALLSVPFLNLIAIPICVTAGTLYFLDRLAGRVPDFRPADGARADRSGGR